MSNSPNPWKRFAEAVRQLDAATAETADPAPSIPWLPDLPGQVHALLLRLIWKRWAIAGIILSLGVLGAFFLDSHPAAPAARVPRIPVPAAP